MTTNRLSHIELAIEQAADADDGEEVEEEKAEEEEEKEVKAWIVKND